MTLDMWFFAAVCLFLCAVLAALRNLPGRASLQDRLIAADVATTLGCAGALVLTVTVGDLLIMVLAGVIACIVFATTLRISEGLTGDAQ